MRERQFQPGEFEVGRMPFRIRHGGKRLADLVIEWRTPFHGWVNVEMRASGMLHAFFVENEDILYPDPEIHLGGDKYRAFEADCELNWQDADKRVAWERAQAEFKRSLSR